MSTSVLFWRIAFVVCAIVLFAMALSSVVYEATSPKSLAVHVLLRKSYATGAFALLGFLLRGSAIAGFSTAGRIALAIGLYSAGIEVRQNLDGSEQGPLWNAFDIADGAFGGALGAWAHMQWDRRTSPR